MAKQIYTWAKVAAGDIISFRYQGKRPTGLLNTIIVLNPKLPYVKSDGTLTYHLTGLKLEERGKVPIIRSKDMVASLLESLGEIEVLSEVDGIYRVEMPDATPATYGSIRTYVNGFDIYRTYNYQDAIKSMVFLEPIELPKGLVGALIAG